MFLGQAGSAVSKIVSDTNRSITKSIDQLGTKVREKFVEVQKQLKKREQHLDPAIVDPLKHQLKQDRLEATTTSEPSQTLTGAIARMETHGLWKKM